MCLLILPGLVAADSGKNDASSQSTASEALSSPIDSTAKIPTYRIELIDGVLSPDVLRVPAGARFELLVVNNGSKPSEFESHHLRQETVLFMGKQKTLPITPLDPGTYYFFDDLQPGHAGRIIAVDTSL